MGRRGSPSSPKSPESRASLGGDASQRRRGQKAVSNPLVRTPLGVRAGTRPAPTTSGDILATATLGSVAP